MAGAERPKCPICGKYYKFDWNTETFSKICGCNDTPKYQEKYKNAWW